MGGPLEAGRSSFGEPVHLDRSIGSECQGERTPPICTEMGPFHRHTFCCDLDSSGSLHTKTLDDRFLCAGFVCENRAVHVAGPSCRALDIPGLFNAMGCFGSPCAPPAPYTPFVVCSRSLVKVSVKRLEPEWGSSIPVWSGGAWLLSQNCPLITLRRG